MLAKAPSSQKGVLSQYHTWPDSTLLSCAVRALLERLRVTYLLALTPTGRWPLDGHLKSPRAFENLPPFAGVFPHVSPGEVEPAHEHGYTSQSYPCTSAVSSCC